MAILNQNLWQFLEEIELYKFTNNAKELWVFTGPLFDEKIKYLKKTSPIEIPDAFYKIYIKILLNLKTKFFLVLNKERKMLLILPLLLILFIFYKNRI